MTKILDLGANPVLGRVHAVNRKHRLRSKHYAAVDDWPETGASIDVLDAAALDETDHYPSTDEVFVVSSKLLEVLCSVDDSIESRELDAGGRTVYLVMPLSDGDVRYESDGFADYSKNGYNVVSGKDMRVNEAPDDAFCEVRNTGLLALRADLVDAADAAGVRWQAVDAIERYEPFRKHPYYVYRTGYAAAHAEELEAEGDWPDVPETVPHPLGEHARDSKVGDVHGAWTKRVHKFERVDNCVFARYCSGLELPALAARLDDDIAKSRVKKRWKETLATGCLQLKGLPCVSSDVRNRMVDAGVEADFVPTPLSDPKTGETTTFFLVHPRHVVDWIDWAGSDVSLRRTGIIDEYFDLEPKTESYDATLPLVRVAGSNIILVHETLAAQLTDDEGFYMTPLHELKAARNLDGGIKAN